jgi:hypothetical protein
VTFFERGGSEVLEVYWKNTAHGVTTQQMIPDEFLLIERDSAESSPAPDVVEVSGKQYNINFTKHGINSQLPDWNDISMDNISGSTSIGNITDIAGNSSDLSVTIFNGELGYTILGVADNQADLHDGVYPDAVLRYAAYTTGKGSIKLSNLDPYKSYSIYVYGGRAGSGERVTEYIINGVTKKLQCMNNSLQVQLFDNLTPNIDQEIVVEFQQGGNTWAYINALVIEEVDNASSRLGTTHKSSELEANIASDAKELSLTAKIKVYPNPFQDRLIITVDSQNYQKADIVVMDQWGKEVYQSTNNLISAGSNELIIDFANSVLKNGLYLLHFKLDENKTETFKLLVE